MKLKYNELPLKQLEAPLEEFAEIVWNEPCTVVYYGAYTKNSEKLLSLLLRTNYGDMKLSLPQSFDVLSTMNLLLSADSNASAGISLAFLGLTPCENPGHTFVVYRNASIDKGPFTFFLLDESKIAYNDCIDWNCGEKTRPLLSSCKIPCVVTLYLPREALLETKLLKCSFGKVGWDTAFPDRDVYIVFQDGGLIMNMHEPATNKIQDEIPIEFVVDGLEMTLTDILSLRPGDTIEIDMSQPLQGVIRMARGDWAYGTLRLEGGHAVLALEKFKPLETFSVEGR